MWLWLWLMLLDDTYKIVSLDVLRFLFLWLFCLFDIRLYSIAKLAGLLVKTLSKPLSKRIKHELTKSTTGTNVLEAVGQASHSLTSRMTIWSAGYKVRNIQALPSDKAVQTGSELVGESFVLVVSAGIIIYEYNRSKQKELEKAEQANAKATRERCELQQQLTAIYARMEAIERTVEHLKGQPPTLQQQPDTDPTSAKDMITNTIESNWLHHLFYWWKKWRMYIYHFMFGLGQ